MTMFGRGAVRPPRPWPYDGSEAAIFSLLAAASISAVVVVAATIFQGSLYRDAGARDVGGAAAFAGLLLVVVVLVGAAGMYRWGYGPRAVGVLAVVAGALGAALAVLPAAVGADGWLACVLSVLVGLLPPLILSGWAVVSARYLPMRWFGWDRPQHTDLAAQGLRGLPRPD